MAIAEKQILNSIIEFNDSSYSEPVRKAALGNNPKYFPCAKTDNGYLFALSKFCFFSDAGLLDYIGRLRYKTDGTVAQKHISRLLNEPWLPLSKTESDLAQAFTKWIGTVHPNYNTANARFILLKKNQESPKKKKKISADELDIILSARRITGRLGEKIALRYEHERLKKLGCKSPKAFITQVSLQDTSAGYDILSSYRGETRLIEVKSSTTTGDNYYLTKNEIEVLEYNKKEAYIYLVHIENVEKEQGDVIRIINNPIEMISSKETMLFKVKF